MRRCLYFLLIVVLFTAVSCSSLSTYVRSRAQGLPEWCFDLGIGVQSSQVCFVCIGSGISSRQARDNAYSNMIEQMESYLGTSVGSSVVRELNATGEISKYAVHQKGRFIKEEDDGKTTVYIRFIANKALMETDRSDSSSLNEDILKEIQALTDSGDEFIKNDQDLNGVSCFLKSMALSYGRDFVPVDCSFDRIKKEVIYILDSINIDISDSESLSGDAHKAECTITVTRKDVHRVFAVQRAKIRASYTAVNADSQEYADSFSFSADDKGTVVFNPVNKSIVPEGRILFSADLFDELEALERIAGSDSVSDIRRIIEEKTVELEYRQTFPDVQIGVIAFDYSQTGLNIGSETALYLSSKFARSRISSFPFEVEHDVPDTQAVRMFAESNPGVPYAVVCRIEKNNVIKSEATGEFNVVCEGFVSVYSTHDDKMLYESGVCYSSAFGYTENEASVNAFTAMADIFFSYIRMLYV